VQEEETRPQHVAAAQPEKKKLGSQGSCTITDPRREIEGTVHRELVKPGEASVKQRGGGKLDVDQEGASR